MINLSYQKNEITDFPVSIAMKDPAGVIYPVDLSGTTLIFTVKKTLEQTDEEADYQIKKTVHEDPRFGLSVFRIDENITGLDPGTYYYDIVSKSPDATWKVLSGSITITTGATQNG